MTKKELSQLYYQGKEIVHIQERLQELEGLATSCTSEITGLPKSNRRRDKVSKYAAPIAELLNPIQAAQR